MPSAVRNGRGELWQIKLPGYLQLSQRWNIPRRAEKGSLCNSRRKAPTTVGCLALLPPIMPPRGTILQRSHLMRIECGPISSTALNIKNSQLSPSPGKLVKQVALNCSTPTLATGEGRRKSADLALQTSVLGVKTLHSTAEVQTKAESWS